MADRAFVTGIRVQATSTPGTFSLIGDVTYMRDDGESAMAAAAFDFTFANTPAQMQAGLVTNIRAVGVDSGYDVSAAGSILLPTFSKV